MAALSLVFHCEKVVKHCSLIKNTHLKKDVLFISTLYYFRDARSKPHLDFTSVNHVLKVNFFKNSKSRTL